MRTRTQPLVAYAAVAAVLSGAGPANAVQVEAAFTTASRYDAGGQLIGTIYADPDSTGPLRLLAVRYTYNQSLLVSVETGELTAFPDETVPPSSWASYGFSGANIFSTLSYAYDAYGRTASESLRGRNGTVESFTQYSYDSQNRLECRAMRMNPAAFGNLSGACTLGPEGSQGPDRITRFTYDGLDQVLTEQRAYGTPLAQTYLTNAYTGHQLNSQTDAKGNRTELTYDTFGRLWKRFYPSATTPGAVSSSDYEEFTYETNGNLRTERRRNGATITYAYDGSDRPIDKILPDHTYSDDVHYDYDLRGLLRAAYFTSTPTLGVFNDFDGFGRPESSTSSVRLGATTVSRTIGYRYDGDGNRTRVTHPDGTFFEYGFDGVDRVGSVAENGTTTLLNVVYRTDGRRQNLLRPAAASTNYDFDNAGRLASLTQDLAGTTSDLTNTFGYNAAGQVTQLTRSNSAYNYVGNANRTGNYAPDGLNRYSIVDGQLIAYDANSNLISDGTLGYTYDLENRLVSTTGVAGALSYDPLGRLTELAIVPGPTTQFLYDGDALVAEYTVSGNTATLARRYVHGDRVDEPWVQYNSAAVGAGNRRYLHADHQGSLIAATDVGGGVLATNSYDAFGIPANGNVDRFGYTGQTWLKELGLDYYKARMYAPKLGRFLQTDPIGYEDDMNLYAYVGNDPLSRTDPSGRKNCEDNDPNCVETPESTAIPGGPPPKTDTVEKMEEVVVTAQKAGKDSNGKTVSFTDKDEHSFVVTTTTITPAPMKSAGSVDCGNGIGVELRKVSAKPGSTIGHSHPNSYGAPGTVPGPGDHQAAQSSSAKAAFMMTSANAFTIEAMSNGTYRVTVSGDQGLSDQQRADLVSNMRNWENPAANKPGLSNKQKYCGKK